MYYLQSRYYDPAIGRFISSDGLLGETGNLLTHNMYAYCANNPVIYVDDNGRMAVLNPCLVVNYLPANHVNRLHKSSKLVPIPILGISLFNISYTVTQSDKAADLFYTYSNTGNGGLEYGAGINIGGWIGAHGFISTPGEIGVGVQISPWVHGSASIGVSGVGATIGINIGNTAYAVSANIGYGTILVVSMAVAPVPGARVAAATTAALLLITGFIQYGDGGYYF